MLLDWLTLMGLIYEVFNLTTSYDYLLELFSKKQVTYLLDGQDIEHERTT